MRLCLGPPLERQQRESAAGLSRSQRLRSSWRGSSHRPLLGNSVTVRTPTATERRPTAGCVRGGGPQAGDQASSSAPPSVPSGTDLAEVRRLQGSSEERTLQALPCFSNTRREGGGRGTRPGRKTWSSRFALFADLGQWSLLKSGFEPSIQFAGFPAALASTEPGQPSSSPAC